MKVTVNTYGYIFFTTFDTWICCKKEDYIEVSNDLKSEKCIKSNHLETIVNLLDRYSDIETIKQNVK